MGYKPKRKIYNLDFAGTDHEGLQVSIRGLNTGQYMDLFEAKAEAEAGGETNNLLTIMASRLVSWNVEDDDDQLVPPTLDGIKTQDLDLNLAIVNAWTTAMAGVPAPLEQPSTSGGSSLEASIPMEVLSQSLAS
ncbi:hypothetical protein [Streptomyces sp. NBC_01264]|uniref:hypothetical protein n=1 Tax=Streptomyces sp. NBC_01264 TaxID=2903804 RepID=UPI00225A0EB6|nr:hypothetical protein [Streptomyces sp. NBC_01264]MCX4778175.1 hypothetical protein [Streptomyces sp. NBC_01264]